MLRRCPRTGKPLSPSAAKSSPRGHLDSGKADLHSSPPQIFYFRPQTVFVSQLFLQVIAFILGKAWASILPKASKGRFWAFLNPCDFNIKEHVAICE